MVNMQEQISHIATTLRDFKQEFWHDYRNLDSKVTVIKSQQKAFFSEQQLNMRNNGSTLLPMYDLFYKHHVTRSNKPPSWYTIIPSNKQMFNVHVFEGLDNLKIGEGSHWGVFTNIRDPPQPMDMAPSVDDGEEDC